MFVNVEEASKQVSKSREKQLKQITSGLDSSLVKAVVNPETGTIRYLDGDDDSILLEVENAF